MLTKVFAWSYPVSPGKCWDSISVRLRPLSFISLPIQYLPFLLFDDRPIYHRGLQSRVYALRISSEINRDSGKQCTVTYSVENTLFLFLGSLGPV
jgi:hypothetical protein